MTTRPQADLGVRLTDSLYTEAMLLADEARGYFDTGGQAGRDLLPPLAQVGFACESLRVTTRLMHVIAWLLTRRAVAAGEITAAQGAAPERRLRAMPAADPEVVAVLPEEARRIVVASETLYDRVVRHDRRLDAVAPPVSPVIDLVARLQAAF